MAILGIDEVGRGPWAGPLVMGAVILPDDKPSWTTDLTDSKKLSTKSRETLNEIILTSASATGLGWVSSIEIDKLGLAKSLRLATMRAVKLVQSLHISFSEIIIDGTVNFLSDTPLSKYVTVLPKADFLIKEVSSASIIAKVARDRYMKDLSLKYPGYGFEKHVGYGTAKHRSALLKLGPCPEHRFSFRPIQELCANNKPVGCAILGEYKRSAVGVRSVAPRETLAEVVYSTGNTTDKGHRAETIVSDYLVQNSHQILARNYKTPFYEIDIISKKAGKIYFTEVKYRKSSVRGTPLETITKSKLDQMHFSAEAFLESHPNLKLYQPILAVSAVSGPTFHFDTWFPLN